MGRTSICLALLGVLTQAGCSQSTDAEVLTATLNHLHSNGTDIGAFAPGSILLLDPHSALLNQELLRALESSASTSQCHFSDTVYGTIAATNTATTDFGRLLSPQDGWRFGSEGELATRTDGLPPTTSDGTRIWSYGSLLLPTYSKDGKTAFALVAFTWDLHTVYGEYTLTKSGDGWRVQCREFHAPYV